MAIITLQDLSIGFRGPTLLDHVNCRIEAGDRIGLLGRNGAGKTTLMRMLAGQLEPDHGQIVMGPDVQVAWLPQEVPQDIAGSIREVVHTGHQVSQAETDHDAELQWRLQHQVDQILSRMELDEHAPFEQLSSGMKRRVLLARALVSEPQVLLLDEPTNHLDIDAITWLEGFLQRWSGTYLFVTHDRMFLRKLANRILEIDRGRLFDWTCDYDTFLRRKEAALLAEEQQDALFDKKLAQEEAWIRQGIKARRTRNEGRVKALKLLREERLDRRERVGTSRLAIQEAERGGRLVVNVENVSFAYGDQIILNKFSTSIMRGDKVGIIGRNGAGKTTLLRLLLGQLAPQSGTVKLGTNLQIAYFDQLRQQLDEEKTVQENVGDGYETIQLGESRRHILGYLQDFLFTPERARTAVKFLSGGERNRILLAKLFAKPANLIVLDEPTNDLDTETLELLEERLVEYGGTLLLVSHDREFLNHVVTSTLVFETGGIKEYVGGYDDWQRQSAQSGQAESADQKAAAKTAGSRQPGNSDAKRATQEKPRKLKFKEQQELKTLPQQIESLEARVAELHERMADADFYKQSGDQIASAQSDLTQLQSELESAYARWEELESLAEGS